MVAQGTRPPPLAPSTWITPAVAISLPMSGVAPVLCAAADIEVMASTQADISAGGFNIFCVYLCLFIIFTPPGDTRLQSAQQFPLAAWQIISPYFPTGLAVPGPSSVPAIQLSDHQASACSCSSPAPGRIPFV